MAACLHHPQVDETEPCDRCGRPFCRQCLARILGQRLCGDCKILAVAGVVQRPQRHPLALISLVVPVVGYTTCVLVPISSPIGLYLGWRVLRELRDRRHYSGRSLALAAMVVSGGSLACWLAALIATVLARPGM